MQVHFNLVNGSESIRDEEGTEVADVPQAKAEVLSAIREMRNEGGDWAGWRLVATNRSGEQLFSLDLATSH
jgi:hypothetical protein